MAQSLYQFDIDDDSPEIAYFPLANKEPGPNINAGGWQLLYTSSGAATAPGQVGVGTSYHCTTLNGASLLINWNGMYPPLQRISISSLHRDLSPTQAQALTS